MQKFDIMLRSLQDVQEFVTLAARQPFAITVGNEFQSIDGKDFMGMFSLDYSRPLEVCIDCPQNRCSLFLQNTAKFLVFH